MFVAGTSGRDVNEYSLSTGFDLSSTVSFVRNLDVSSKETYIAGIAFNTTGTKMFISGVANTAHEYSLSTGFDLSTGMPPIYFINFPNMPLKTVCLPMK